MAHDYRDTILAELDNAGDSPGDFCCGGVLTSKPPQLQVQGVGRLALPLSAAQAEALAVVAVPAPCGKGTATLLDPSVRRSLQLEPAQCSVANEEEWGTRLARAVKLAAEGLGLPPGNVEAELYKLLLYRPGDFFRPHQDMEKAEGKVATLIILLPSTFEGGALLVRHRGRQRSFLAGGGPGAATSCSFAAFYADCEHEVQEVASGHRLALVYNLLHVGSGPPPAVPDAAAALAPLRRALQAWQADAGGPEKLCIMLDHQYTQAGIGAGLRALKGVDRAAGRALAAAKAEGLVDVHLAILEKHETGETIDVQWSLDHWVTLDGQRQKLGHMPVDEDEEVLPADFFEDLDPDEQKVEGFTGNAGPTMDRFYRRAALVVWPVAGARAESEEAPGAASAALVGQQRQQQGQGQQQRQQRQQAPARKQVEEVCDLLSGRPVWKPAAGAAQPSPSVIDLTDSP